MDLLDKLIEEAKAKKAKVTEPLIPKEEKEEKPEEIQEEKSEEAVKEVKEIETKESLESVLKEKVEEKPSTPIEKVVEKHKDLIEKKSQELEVYKDTILIAAEKSDGKTTAAYSFEGTKFVFAYDNQALTAAQDLPFVMPEFADKVSKIVEVAEPDEPYTWFKVLDKDGNVYMTIHLVNQLFRPKSPTDEEIGKAASAVVAKTFEILSKLEEEVAEDPSKRPDWIIVDNFELFVRWSDWHARHERNIGIFQKGALPGQDYWGVYDERLALIRVFWSRVLALAKKGVIYTTYVREIETITGESRKVPKWVEAVKYETMHHFLIWKEFTVDGKPKYYAKVLGTKNIRKYPDGLEVEITNKGLERAIREKVEASE